MCRILGQQSGLIRRFQAIKSRLDSSFFGNTNNTESNFQIHTSGVAKYVLLSDNKSHFLVSDPSAEYHSDIVTKLSNKMGKVLNCLGGGRIEVSANRIRVYGFSQIYGSPPDLIVQRILEENIRDKQIILMIGEGY